MGLAPGDAEKACAKECADRGETFKRCFGVKIPFTHNAVSFCNCSKYRKELTKEAQKGIRSLEKRIAEHEKKLADFNENPTVRPGMEGQSESTIKKAQESRVRHLEKEIQTFRENIEKLKGGQ